MNFLEISCLFLLLPFFGAIFSYIKAYNDYRSGIWFCICSVFLSFIASCCIFYNFISTQLVETIYLFTWIKSGTIKIDWGFFLDPLSILMVMIITFISSLIHVYSMEYMREDPNKMLFFGHLNFFTFMMIFLVTAPNMLQLFCGWEGISFISYLLIGYWHNKPAAVTASIKAFSINRISDVGLILAIGSIFSLFHTLDFESLFMFLKKSEYLPDAMWLNIICLFLFFAAMGKSAQFGLHVWLPNAMEAPTPVSALLHSATMVTAGVFLVIRFSSLFELAFLAKQVMMFVGALTGLVAGLIALTQNDIKKIIAYSTSSQLGLMFMACAVDAYAVAFFYLCVHAFVKALIFLCAGSIIHAMSHEQNIMKMGGLKTHLRFSYYSMLAGVLALIGFPLTAGFYSKECIASSIYFATIPFSSFYFSIFLILVFVTGLYAWRIFFVVFYGKVNAGDQVIAHIQKIRKVMQYPIDLLILCAVCMGYIGFELFVKQSFGFSWGDSIVVRMPEYIPLWMKLCMFIVSLLAFTVSYFACNLNNRKLSTFLEKFSKIYETLKNGLYLEELYSQKIIFPLLRLGSSFYQIGDRKIIDKFGPEGVPKLVFKASEYLKKFQTGYLPPYVFIAIFGVVLILTSCIAIRIFPKVASEFLFAVGHL